MAFCALVYPRTKGHNRNATVYVVALDFKDEEKAVYSVTMPADPRIASLRLMWRENKRFTT